MKKIILSFGLVVGVLFCANIFFMIYWMYYHPEIKSNDVVGYATMVLQFSLIFFGVRNYRNKYLQGQINFGKAFKTGALIAFVGSTVYVLVWVCTYYLYVPDFADVYSKYVLEHCAKDDLTEKTKEMEVFKNMYNNPLFVVLITYFEILPVGLVVALVSALILKKKPKVSNSSRE